MGIGFHSVIRLKYRGGRNNFWSQSRMQQKNVRSYAQSGDGGENEITKHPKYTES